MSKEVGQNWYLLPLGVHTKSTFSHLVRGIIAISAPMIYTAPCVMLLMQAVFIMRACGGGGGAGPWKLRLFGPCEMELSR
jgi:hypothetical protein